MKSLIKIAAAWMFIQLVYSCAPTVKVTTDYDKAVSFANFKTYMIYNLKSTGSVSELNADRIINAIKAEMGKKGFTENTTNPDLMVNAVTIMKDKRSVTANTNYYGYGGVYRPYGYYGGGMASGTTTYNTYDYKDGSLIIDIVDNNSKKLIWQGTGNAEIDAMPKDPDAFISSTVAKIMAGFPPGKK